MTKVYFCHMRVKILKIANTIVRTKKEISKQIMAVTAQTTGHSTDVTCGPRKKKNEKFLIPGN